MEKSLTTNSDFDESRRNDFGRPPDWDIGRSRNNFSYNWIEEQDVKSSDFRSERTRGSSEDRVLGPTRGDNIHFNIHRPKTESFPFNESPKEPFDSRKYNQPLRQYEADNWRKTHVEDRSVIDRNFLSQTDYAGGYDEFSKSRRGQSVVRKTSDTSPYSRDSSEHNLRGGSGKYRHTIGVQQYGHEDYVSTQNHRNHTRQNKERRNQDRSTGNGRSNIFFSFQDRNDERVHQSRTSNVEYCFDGRSLQSVPEHHNWRHIASSRTFGRNYLDVKDSFRPRISLRANFKHYDRQHRDESLYSTSFSSSSSSSSSIRRMSCGRYVMVTCIILILSVIAGAITLSVVLSQLPTGSSGGSVKYAEIELRGTIQEKFIPEYSNTSSAEFRNLSIIFCDAVMEFSNRESENDVSQCIVDYIRNGSCIISFRLVFTLSGTISTATLSDQIQTVFNTTSGSITVGVFAFIQVNVIRVTETESFVTDPVPPITLSTHSVTTGITSVSYSPVATTQTTSVETTESNSTMVKNGTTMQYNSPVTTSTISSSNSHIATSGIISKSTSQDANSSPTTPSSKGSGTTIQINITSTDTNYTTTTPTSASDTTPTETNATTVLQTTPNDPNTTITILKIVPDTTSTDTITTTIPTTVSETTSTDTITTTLPDTTSTDTITTMIHDTTSTDTNTTTMSTTFPETNFTETNTTTMPTTVHETTSTDNVLDTKSTNTIPTTIPDTTSTDTITTTIPTAVSETTSIDKNTTTTMPTTVHETTSTDTITTTIPKTVSETTTDAITTTTTVPDTTSIDTTATKTPTTVPEAAPDDNTMTTTPTNLPEATSTDTIMTTVSTSAPEATSTDTIMITMQTNVPKTTSTDTIMTTVPTNVPQATSTDTIMITMQTNVPEATSTDTIMTTVPTNVPEATSTDTNTTTTIPQTISDTTSTDTNTTTIPTTISDTTSTDTNTTTITTTTSDTTSTDTNTTTAVPTTISDTTSTDTNTTTIPTTISDTTSTDTNATKIPTTISDTTSTDTNTTTVPTTISDTTSTDTNTTTIPTTIFDTTSIDTNMTTIPITILDTNSTDLNTKTTILRTISDTTSSDSTTPDTSATSSANHSYSTLTTVESNGTIQSTTPTTMPNASLPLNNTENVDDDTSTLSATLSTIPSPNLDTDVNFVSLQAPSVEQGGTLTMTCSSSISQLLTVKFVNKEEIVAVYDGSSVQVSNRYSSRITVSSGNRSFDLNFLNVSCEDEGLYICESVMVDGSRTNASLTVKVFDKPDVPSLKIYVHIVENTEFIRHTCTGYVGRPRGNLTIEIKRNGTTNFVESPDLVVPGGRTVTDMGCGVYEEYRFGLSLPSSYNLSTVRCRAQNEYSIRSGDDFVSSNEVIALIPDGYCDGISSGFKHHPLGCGYFIQCSNGVATGFETGATNICFNFATNNIDFCSNIPECS